MIYKNARIFAYGNSFRMGAFEVTADGRFGKLLFDETPAEGIDLQGATVMSISTALPAQTSLTETRRV